MSGSKVIEFPAVNELVASISPVPVKVTSTGPFDTSIVTLPHVTTILSPGLNVIIETPPQTFTTAGNNPPETSDVMLPVRVWFLSYG